MDREPQRNSPTPIDAVHRNRAFRRTRAFRSAEGAYFKTTTATT